MVKEAEFNQLDMNNYKVEKLPKIEKSGFEKTLMFVAWIIIYGVGRDCVEVVGV